VTGPTADRSNGGDTNPKPKPVFETGIRPLEPFIASLHRSPLIAPQGGPTGPYDQATGPPWSVACGSGQRAACKALFLIFSAVAFHPLKLFLTTISYRNQPAQGKNILLAAIPASLTLT